MSTPGRSTVGRYELRERLGAGGMGTVWRAWDPSLRRDVAIKEVLLPEGMDPEERDEARARTLREAQATARISDTAVVTVHDVLEHGGSPWIVMELLSGTSLQHRLDRHGPLPVERAEEAARSLLAGLRAAHTAGVTHRDVKPANIMLTDDGRTVLTDFGIADVEGGTALTRTGVYIGSPEYMAPERFEGERALPASDLWSLGVTLYTLLEGRSPFKRDTVTGIITAVLTAPLPPRPSAVDAGAGGAQGAPLRALIGALLDRDVSTRPGPEEALALLERGIRERDRGGGTGPHGAAGTGPRSAPGAEAPNQPGGHRTGPNAPPPHAPPPRTAPPDASGSVPRQWPGGRAPATPPRGGPNPAPGGPVGGTAHGPGAPGLPGTLGAPGGPARYAPRPDIVPPQRPYTGPVPGGTAGHPSPGTGTGRAPLPGRPGGAADGPGAFGPAAPGGAAAGGQGAWRSGRPAAARPASVVTAAVLLGLNALYLLVLTAALAGSGDAGAGTVAGIGLWGLFSAFAAPGVLVRSRLVCGAVVLVQLVGSVALVLSMFPVFIYTPEQLPLYALMLVFNLVIAGLVLVPPRARAFFGFGPGRG